MNEITILGLPLPLLIAEIGIVVTTLSAAVGIWIERDREKPIRTPIALTVLVLCAAGLSIFQCRQEDVESSELEDNLAKVMLQLDEVATKSQVELPELNDVLKSELMMHGRANPRVLMELAKNIAAKGGDPLVVLASYLPEADLQAMKRAGHFDEALTLAAVANTEPTQRPKLTFGSGAPYMRSETPVIADAGADAAPAMGEPSDGGIADGGAGADAAIDAGNDEESLKLQIVEARRLLAEAKTETEKRERQRQLFELLGVADMLHRKNATQSSTAAPPGSASSPAKKPEIEIEEDDTP